VQFFNYTTGSRKNRIYWERRVGHIGNDNGFTLELAPENFLTRIVTHSGMQDITIGDPVFDRSFLIRSNKRGLSAAALLPEIRARLLSKREQGSPWPTDGEGRCGT